MLRYARYLLMVGLLPVLTFLAAPGCAPYEDEPAPANGNSEKVKNLPQPEEPWGNPKLGSALDQLVIAAEQGEAEACARSGGIELLDGSVRVIIECVPDQVEEAARAAGVLGTVELATRSLVQLVLPIGNLTDLSRAESILVIRLPDRPVPG